MPTITNEEKVMVRFIISIGILLFANSKTNSLHGVTEIFLNWNYLQAVNRSITNQKYRFAPINNAFSNSSRLFLFTIPFSVTFQDLSRKLCCTIVNIN